MNGGIQNKILGEGMNFIIPIIQTPIKYEIRVNPKMISSHTGTKDLQVIKDFIKI